ncbi:MAG: hypothetical protein RLZZ67_383 [Candidatus Parcubacteria bacterium]|jgi:predicted  nucleic acid-binding Zn-ribbon protein
MNMLRKLLLLVVIAGSFSYSGYRYFKNPCDEPLQYTIGIFNEKFGVSKADFMQAIREAEAIWEQPTGKQLFAYSETAGMPINLVYDERQATVQQNKKLADKIDLANGSADNVKSQLETTKLAYARVKAEYEALSAEFKSRQDAHGVNVSYWNKKGGAPENEYAQLNKESEALNTLYASLEKKRAEVNALANELNGLVGSYNGIIKNINSNVAVINESADKEFEQGEYISDAQGTKINVYEFTDRDALVRVLAHELGHALGMDHNDNPESVMYYLNKNMVMSASVDDLSSLKMVCKFK